MHIAIGLVRARCTSGAAASRRNTHRYYMLSIANVLGALNRRPMR